jgi:hypothetical protein
MNTPNEPESIETKIALLEAAVREQMSALADVGRVYWRESQRLDSLKSRLEALKEEAEQIEARRRQ